MCISNKNPCRLAIDSFDVLPSRFIFRHSTREREIHIKTLVRLLDSVAKTMLSSRRLSHLRLNAYWTIVQYIEPSRTREIGSTFHVFMCCLDDSVIHMKKALMSHTMFRCRSNRIDWSVIINEVLKRYLGVVIRNGFHSVTNMSILLFLVLIHVTDSFLFALLLEDNVLFHCNIHRIESICVRVISF